MAQSFEVGQAIERLARLELRVGKMESMINASTVVATAVDSRVAWCLDHLIFDKCLEAKFDNEKVLRERDQKVNDRLRKELDFLTRRVRLLTIRLSQIRGLTSDNDSDDVDV